jgi:hypothetical protein
MKGLDTIVEALAPIEAKWEQYFSLKDSLEMSQSLDAFSDLWREFHIQQSPSQHRIRFFIGYVLWSFFYDLKKWSFDNDLDDFEVGMETLREELKARFPSVMSAMKAGNDQASLDAAASMIAQICPTFHQKLGGLYFPSD